MKVYKSSDGTILGIENRTENWRTAAYLLRLQAGHISLLAERLGESRLKPSEVKLELFWKGVRDYLHSLGTDRPDHDNLSRRYNRLFSDLHQKVKGYSGLNCGEKYQVGGEESKKKLYDNLFNTEIDIVLETPSCLFVGEAKHKMDSLGTNGNYVLVHQLIRQYVTANILVDLIPCKSKPTVIPFLVVDTPEAVRRKHQVKFMIKQGWLKAQNILSWNEIKNLKQNPGQGME